MDPKEKPHNFVVRLPLRLRDQIADAATYYRRSMNSEIVARLEHTFSGLPPHVDAQQMEPHMHQAIENLFARSLNHDEERVVRAFRRLTEDKKTALLELLD